MLKLIKYEFVKKYRMFMSVIITTILAGIFISIKFGEMGFPVFTLVLSIGLFMLYAVDVIQMYSQDINKRTGYMVFMTPNSGYKIISSKVITALLEGLGMLIFFILIITLNSAIIYGLESLFQINFYGLDISYNEVIINMFIFLVAVLLLSIQFLLTIYSAITIRKSVLSNVKFKGLISFGIFILLNYVIEKIYTIPYRLIDISMYEHVSSIPSPGELLKVLTPAMLTAAAVCVLLTFLSGYLLEKKINL